MNELLQQRKLRIRRKFRAIIRQVINNRHWLLDPSNMQLGDNIRQNITLIYKSKDEHKSSLSLEQKCLMRKRAEWRTDAEKNILYNSIGGLKCFRKWPDNVKFKLVSCTYFVYFEPGRTIVKQDRHAQALYFIVGGQVEVTQRVFDEVIQQWVTISKGTLGPGSMFGEVSLLKKVPRTASITTKTHCELLWVDQEDFDDTLRVTLKEQWDEIKIGLSNFPYFTGLNDNLQTECCMLSKLKEYEPKQIVYSCSNKKFNNAYFILKGSCKLIEKINIKERKVGRHTAYSIYKQQKTAKHYGGETHAIAHANLSAMAQKTHLFLRKEEIKREIYEKCPTVKGLLTQFGGLSKMTKDIETDNESTASFCLPKDVYCHFIEVCTLREMACFFENEIFRNRYLMAETHMKLLIIPMYWLLLNNRANIWNRIDIYMKNLIPTTEQVFKKFLENRKWILYKKELTREVLGKRDSCVDTVWSDIPISLRIAEVYKDIN